MNATPGPLKSYYGGTTMPNAVLVIDMVRGFLEPGHNLYCAGYRDLIPPHPSPAATGNRRRLCHPVHRRPPRPGRPGVSDFPRPLRQRHGGAGSHPRTGRLPDRGQPRPQKPLQRLFQHRPLPASGAAAPGPGYRLRRLHRHLHPLHHRRCPQPGLRRGRARRLRRHL